MNTLFGISHGHIMAVTLGALLWPSPPWWPAGACATACVQAGPAQYPPPPRPDDPDRGGLDAQHGHHHQRLRHRRYDQLQHPLTERVAQSGRDRRDRDRQRARRPATRRHLSPRRYSRSRARSLAPARNVDGVTGADRPDVAPAGPHLAPDQGQHACWACPHDYPSAFGPLTT